MVVAKYYLRFFFDMGGCLWPGDDEALRDFDFGPYDCHSPCPLELSKATVERCQSMAGWYDTSINWDYPPDPGPWRQAECERFNAAVQDLLTKIRGELGQRFIVLNEQRELFEDPDLEAYLANPKGFRRAID